MSHFSASPQKVAYFYKFARKIRHEICNAIFSLISLQNAHLQLMAACKKTILVVVDAIYDQIYKTGYQWYWYKDKLPQYMLLLHLTIIYA